jgi:hypothetical protein
VGVNSSPFLKNIYMDLPLDLSSFSAVFTNCTLVIYDENGNQDYLFNLDSTAVTELSSGRVQIHDDEGSHISLYPSQMVDLGLTVADLTVNVAECQGGVTGLAGQSGYSHTGAFEGKPLSNNYVWQAGTGINYTQADVDNEIFKVFSLSPTVHAAVDNPYWTTPTPTGETGIGLFQGANLPNGVTTLLDYSYDYDTNYPLSEGTGFEGSTGRIKLNDLEYGDQLRVRFDFNVIPQIANTTVEPALWYSNRDDNDDITFTFPLTSQPIFYGGGTVGNTFLNRIEISAWITSNEDINALTLPAIKSDNPVIIQPLGLLITIIR